jgi:hypothetical protein
VKYLGDRVAVLFNRRVAEGWVILTLGGAGAAEILGVEVPGGYLVFRSVQTLYGGVP